ncbi:MAG TPA: hypothetical protein VD758_02660 [Gemmatimonadaceae bacterium]|jgi:hypothetical protein|nr:hypothetical protein [Gemmatimonadaceae bacterium]
MFATLRRAAFIAAITATAVSAQSQSSAAVPDSTVQDSAALNAVKDFSIRSGKLVLSSAANPGPVHLPDGTYSDESNTAIVIRDGKIARIQQASGDLIEVSVVRLNRRGVITVTPYTNALMAVSDMPLPTGTFKSDDGVSSIRIVLGRPTAFTLASPNGKDEKK